MRDQSEEKSRDQATEPGTNLRHDMGDRWYSEFEVWRDRFAETQRDQGAQHGTNLRFETERLVGPVLNCPILTGAQGKPKVEGKLRKPAGWERGSQPPTGSPS